MSPTTYYIHKHEVVIILVAIGVWAIVTGIVLEHHRHNVAMEQQSVTTNQPAFDDSELLTPGASVTISNTSNMDTTIRWNIYTLTNHTKTTNIVFGVGHCSMRIESDWPKIGQYQ